MSEAWYFATKDFKWTLTLRMQTKNSYSIPSCQQDALLVELNPVLEAKELALTERHKLRFILKKGFESDSSLPRLPV